MTEQRPLRRGVDPDLHRLGRCSYDSFTPMGGAAHHGMMFGEVTPGGVGSGLYTILIYAIIAVFIGGLMVGRTPEYLGKKIQATEVKLAGLGTLVMPIDRAYLHGAGRGDCTPAAVGPQNSGRHGFSEILYGLPRRGTTTDPPFGGLTGNTPFYNILGGIDMLIGRFGIMIPAPRAGGVLAAKPVVAASAGTFRPTRRLRRPADRRHHHRRRPDCSSRPSRSDRSSSSSATDSSSK